MSGGSTANTGPTVTAIVTFWNRERYLREAIESVLGQRHAVELVLVNDGSTDGSADIARRFVAPARLLEQDNRGAPGAANTAMQNATGDYIAFCDSDDIWTTCKLDVQLAALAADPTLDFVFGHGEEFLSPELDPATIRTRAIREVIPAKLPSAALFRRSLFDRVGPFDERLQSGAWVNWYARAHVIGVRETMLPEVVLRRRIHEANNFSMRQDAALDYLRALRPLVQKHRDS